jgi:RNA polymerase sigma-70 factor (ECF subfamily)
MDEVEPVAIVNRLQAVEQVVAPPVDDWVSRLSDEGGDRHQATRELHELMLRAARHQIARMPAGADLGWARREEIVHAAADEATTAVLARLATFEGRSRFTTWAYKFAILQTAVEVRRASWRPRETDLTAVEEPVSQTPGPELYAESDDLTRAVGRAMDRVLTAHQRQVARALLVDAVPIDVLAARLGSNRNALYKTLHDARVRLRGDLMARGYLPHTTSEETIS